MGFFKSLEGLATNIPIVGDVVNLVGSGVGRLGSALETKKTDKLRRSPEEIERERKILDQFETQAKGDDRYLNELSAMQDAYGKNLQSQAAQEAASFAASQSGQATNPNIAIRAGAMAMQDAQGTAQQRALEQGMAMQQLAREDQARGQAALAQQAQVTRELEARGELGNLESSRESRKSALDTASNIGASAAKIGTSDKNKKQAIEKISGKVEDFLDKLDPYTFEYTDDVGKDGEYVGVMAQDLEKSELGSEMVFDSDQGKQVDFGQGFGALLASQAEMLRRISEIEGSIKKGKK